MMWLAGLMGLVGLGAATYVDTNEVNEDKDDKAAVEESSAERIDLLADANIMSADDMTPSNTEDAMPEGIDVDDIAQMDWAADGAAAVITDFALDEDTLLFVWDDTDTQNEAPEIALQQDPENPDHLQVMMGEELRAQISGPDAITEAEIALIPLSSAQALELIAS